MSRSKREIKLPALLKEVARLVVDDSQELEQALNRTARKQGIKLRRGWPSREALQRAIEEYRGLFRPKQSEHLMTQRLLALEAMRSFAEFKPQLTGALVQGDGPFDRIRLLLFANAPEQVILHLSDRGMPWQSAEATMHFSGDRRIAHPALRFIAGDSTVELVVLDPKARSDPPRDAISGGKLETLDTDQLSELLDR